jgi:aspartate/methionine/tyrosine aminotransferase
MDLPDRARHIKPFIVMEVLEKAQEMESRGIDVIHLEVGEPDFDVPESVRIASNVAMRTGHTHYTHSLGDPELRGVISKEYQKRYGLDIDPGRIVITSGSSPAIHLILSVLMEAGQEVIIPDPGYACYPNFIRHLGGKPVTVAGSEENGFQYDPAEVKKKISDKTAAIFINSPSNPTGHLTPPENMQAITALGKWIISDEIYHGLVYEGKEHSILEFTEKAFVVSGFSKQFAMTGLRIGYLIAPPEYVRPIQKLQQNLFICASSVAQRAAIVAIEGCRDEIAEMRGYLCATATGDDRQIESNGFRNCKRAGRRFLCFCQCKKVFE